MWLVLVCVLNSLDRGQASVFTRPGFGSTQPRCQPHFASAVHRSRFHGIHDPGPVVSLLL